MSSDKPTQSRRIQGAFSTAPLNQSNCWTNKLGVDPKLGGRGWKMYGKTGGKREGLIQLNNV